MSEESKIVSHGECTLYIIEFVDVCAYLRFHFSLPGGMCFRFRLFNFQEHKKWLRRVLNNKLTVLWYESSLTKLKHQKSSRQFYYNQHHFYYYKNSVLYEVALNEDHIETIREFLISTER